MMGRALRRAAHLSCLIDFLATMSIKPSAATEIRTLLAGLASGDYIRRETAIARLAIIGPRAVDRMLTVYSAGDRDTRIAILRALEAIADPRALAVAREAIAGGGDVAVAAAGTLRALLDSPADATATASLDVLVATALSASAERRVRVAAFEALRDMPSDIRQRVADALGADPDRAVHPASRNDTAANASDALWQDAVEGRLPDDPAALRELLSSRASSAPLGVLQRLVDAFHARERDADGTPRRSAWRGLRGEIHQSLGMRGSTIALYDLRETLAAAQEPLPASFVGALQAIGDASCLEPMASAHARAAAGDASAARWRAQLEQAFRTIAAREKITRKSAVMKRVERKWPGAVDALLPAHRKTRG
jgi:hypothetical protein